VQDLQNAFCPCFDRQIRGVRAHVGLEPLVDPGQLLEITFSFSILVFIFLYHSHPGSPQE
jgi:hypothetical protein